MGDFNCLAGRGRYQGGIMDERKEAKPNREHDTEPLSIGSIELLSTCGYTCFFSWYFMMVFWVAPSLATGTALLIVQIAFLAGVACATTIVPNLANLPRLKNLVTKKRSTAVLLVIACSVSTILAFVQKGQGSIAVLTAPMALAGLASVFYFATWEEIGSHVRLRDPFSFVPVSLCCGATLFVAFHFLFPGSVHVLCILAILGSSVLAMYVRTKLFPVKANPEEERSWIDHRQLKHVKISILFAVIGVGFGFVLSLATLLDLPFLLASLAVGSLLGLALLLVLQRTNLTLSISMLQRIVIGGTSIALVAASLASDVTALRLCLGAAIVLWVFFRAFNGGLLMKYALASNLPVSHYLAAGKIGSNVGILIGWIIGLATTAFELDRPTITCLLAVVILVVGFALLPFAQDRENGDSAKAGEAHAEKVTDQRVYALADRYELSPREGEVFGYLARGRNAKAVAKILMISENTAKAHVYHIYQKMDVHSLQELIDLVECERV